LHNIDVIVFGLRKNNFNKGPAPFGCYASHIANSSFKQGLAAWGAVFKMLLYFFQAYPITGDGITGLSNLGNTVSTKWM